MAHTVVDAARQALGPVGVCLPVSFASTPPADLQREAVGRLERAGYRAVWTNEVIGKDALVQVAMLLAATEQMVFGTCIANIWARPAQTRHGATAQLAQAYPGRFVFGLGVGYPAQAASIGQEFGSPLATMRDYLDRMDRPHLAACAGRGLRPDHRSQRPENACAGRRKRGRSTAGHAASGVHRPIQAVARTGQAPGGRAICGSGLRPGSGESNCAGIGIGQTRLDGRRRRSSRAPDCWRRSCNASTAHRLRLCLWHRATRTISSSARRTQGRISSVMLQSRSSGGFRVWLQQWLLSGLTVVG